MTDKELADYLHIPLELVPKIDPRKRAAYEHMADIEFQLKLWQAGAGPFPAGVLVD